MRWLESAYPDKARGWVGFNVPMSHKITAACDLLLMPSRFEPCGLNQLYAMRYGTVPVAHATGGLRDTVLPFNPWEGAHQPVPCSMHATPLLSLCGNFSHGAPALAAKLPDLSDCGCEMYFLAWHALAPCVRNAWTCLRLSACASANSVCCRTLISFQGAET